MVVYDDRWKDDQFFYSGTGVKEDRTYVWGRGTLRISRRLVEWNIFRWQSAVWLHPRMGAA